MNRLPFCLMCALGCLLSLPSIAADYSPYLSQQPGKASHDRQGEIAYHGWGGYGGRYRYGGGYGGGYGGYYTPQYSTHYYLEPTIPVNRVPTAILTVDTPTVMLGDTVTVHVNASGEAPISIYWRAGNNPNWQEGGTTLTFTATQPGTIIVSVVIKDGNGLYSQPQSAVVNVLTPSPPNKGPGGLAQATPEPAGRTGRTYISG